MYQIAGVGLCAPTAVQTHFWFPGMVAVRISEYARQSVPHIPAVPDPAAAPTTNRLRLRYGLNIARGDTGGGTGAGGKSDAEEVSGSVL